MHAVIVNHSTSEPFVPYSAINRILSKITHNAVLEQYLTPWLQHVVYTWSTPENSDRVVQSTCAFDSGNMLISTTHECVETAATLSIEGSANYRVLVLAKSRQQDVPNVVTEENIVKVSIVQRQSLVLPKCSYHFDMVWTGATKDAAELMMTTNSPQYKVSVSTVTDDMDYMCKKVSQCWSSATNCNVHLHDDNVTDTSTTVLPRIK